MDDKTVRSDSAYLEMVIKIVRILTVLFLSVQVLVTSYVVFGRYVLSKTPAWGEASALLCMVWFALLSASIATYNNAHIKLRLIFVLVKDPKKIKMLNRLNYLVTFGFSIFMIIEGSRVSYLVRNGIVAGMGISRSWLYLSVPVAGFFLLLTLIGKGRELV